MNTIILIIILFWKKPIHADYSALTKEIESSHKAPDFKVGDRNRITKYKNNFSKGYTGNWSKNLPKIVLCLEILN